MYQLVIFFAALLLLMGRLGLPGSVSAAGFQDRLSVTEIEIATSLALESDGVSQKRLAQAPLPTQTLLVDIKQRKHPDEQDERHAEVFLYDYERELTAYRLVALSRRQVIVSKTLQTHHLPLNHVERQFALQQVKNNVALWLKIQSEWRLIANKKAGSANSTGNSRARLDSLQTKVSILEPLAEQSLCALARCALLTFTTDQRVSLSIEPVVVMATGDVLLRKQLLE